MYKEIELEKVSLPFTTESAFYLEGSNAFFTDSCYTIIGAAILSNKKEIALLLENDTNGEEDLAFVILSVNAQLPLLRRSTGKPIGAYQQKEAFFIKREKWCEAYNDIEIELDDRCYENFVVLTDEEINKI